MRWYCNADKGGSSGNELCGDSWCDQIDWYQLLLGRGSWFGRCGSTRFWWCLNDASSKVRCAVVIVDTWGGYDGGGSVRWRCGGLVMSWAVSSLDVETGEEGVGETECVVSMGFVGSV